MNTAFRFVNSPVFDDIMGVVMEVIAGGFSVISHSRVDSVFIQLVARWIGIGTLINYLKLTESNSVDRIVLLLKFLNVLVQDGYNGRSG